MRERNLIQLIGYVGEAPWSKAFENGNRMVKMKVATHEPAYNKQGEQSTEFTTTWHIVIAWGDKAVFALNNFITGSRIMIDGKLTYRTYPDKAGHIRYVTEILAHSLINLDR